jgi:hypothetical protein
MTWRYKRKLVTDIPDGVIGFVYQIVNKQSGRKYIGKKLFYFSKVVYKTVTLKNGTQKKKRVRSKVESDWKNYYGSNLELNNDVLSLGKEHFTREILFYCRTKAECSYIEAREQFSRKVLESDDYYNGQIQVRIHKNHVASAQLLHG